MNIKEVDNICYACGGCYNSCSSSAISYENVRGITYPSVNNSKCVQCSRCVKICQKEISGTIPTACYLFETEHEADLLNASSGGAFYELVKIFMSEENSFVYGVTYNRELRVCHQCADNLLDVQKFRKSKYVQSEFLNTFPDIEKKLQLGSKILFSGTPCQIVGLRKYLSHDYPNLFTIDLICTGVMAPTIFEKFIKHYSSSNVTGFDWRFKHEVNRDEWNIMDSSIEIDGEKKQDGLSILLKRLYGRKIGYKEACYSCEFSSKKRYSDITLGDYWGTTSSFSSSPNKGTSVILVNSDRGDKLVSKISRTRLKRISIDEIIMQNPSLSHASHRPINNDAFWNEFNNTTIEALLKKFTKNSLKSSLKMLVARVVPKKLWMIIRNGKG